MWWKPDPIFATRVSAPLMSPVIASAADALAVILNERGQVDLDHISELLHRDPSAVIEELGDGVFSDPTDGSWQTSDAYLSGAFAASCSQRKPQPNLIQASSAPHCA